MVWNGLWNANVHYYPLLLKAIPAEAERVLDVGCGDGILCAELASAGVRHIVGLDADAGVLARAKSHHGDLSIEWKHGNVLEVEFAEAAFDAVLSVAALHHIDAALGLARFAQIVRPGGVVGVVGLAANNWWDLPYATIAHGARTALGLTYGHLEQSSPMVWPPPVTYQGMKHIAKRVIPGARYRRHLLGRYSLIWKKPL
jgi:2-polyprenyl-3-methyl-5-hydroxy-6-metoxy-1,4-benzoquinol methylase